MTIQSNFDAWVKVENEIDPSQFAKAELDIAYANDSINQTMDIFYPEQGDGPYPVVVVFHGGAFVTGHKRSQYIKGMCQPVFHGYAVVSVEYRLIDEAKWPAQLIDGKAAIRFLHANAQKYNLDTDRICVWGNSAGGMMTQLIACTSDNLELDDLSVGVEASSRVHGSIAWYSISELMSCEQFGFDIAEARDKAGAGKGMMPNDGKGKQSMFTNLLGFNPLCYPEKTVKVSPIAYVTKDCPPTLLQHGTNDMVVDPKQSVYMKNKIDEVCGEGRAQLDLFEGEPHGSPEIKADPNINRCMDWLDEVFWDGKNPYRQELKDMKILQHEED